MGDCLAEFAFRDDRISRSAGSFFLWREVSRGGCSALAGDVVVADGRSEGDESFDFRVLVRRVDVEVDGRL
jgi:hypothetical protein